MKTFNNNGKDHRSRSAGSRAGVTIVESCVVIGMILVLLALVAPAVHQARVLARRQICAGNLQQIGLAVSSYMEATGRYPAVFTRAPRHHGWISIVLPYLDQAELYSRYDFSVHWCDPANADVIATPIPVLECPAAAYPGRMAVGETMHPYRGAVLDYLATNRVSPVVPERGWLPKSTNVKGILSREEWCRPSDISDGTSHTILVAEVAGTPDKYVFREKEPEPMYGRRGFGAWADLGVYIQGHGQQPNGRDWPGPCTINCTNDDAIYSFHDGGANILFADGTVRFLSEKLDVFVLMAAMTRANGEVLRDDDF